MIRWYTGCDMNHTDACCKQGAATFRCTAWRQGLTHRLVPVCPLAQSSTSLEAGYKWGGKSFRMSVHNSVLSWRQRERAEWHSEKEISLAIWAYEGAERTVRLTEQQRANLEKKRIQRKTCKSPEKKRMPAASKLFFFSRSHHTFHQHSLTCPAFGLERVSCWSVGRKWRRVRHTHSPPSIILSPSLLRRSESDIMPQVRTVSLQPSLQESGAGECIMHGARNSTHVLLSRSGCHMKGHDLQPAKLLLRDTSFRNSLKTLSWTIKF